MSQTARIIALQQRLRATLAAISEQAERISQERCPYRDARDLCTFAYGCRNQLQHGDARRCSGAPLNHARP